MNVTMYAIFLPEISWSVINIEVIAMVCCQHIQSVQAALTFYISSVLLHSCMMQVATQGLVLTKAMSIMKT